jgi:hypothetical protein
MNDISTIYVRLLNYRQATELIRYYNSKFDQDGNATASITSGGVAIQGKEVEFNAAREFLDNKGWRHELNSMHPSETTKQIIKEIVRI